MNDNKMSEIIEASVNSLKSMAGADTIIGDAIKADDGTTIIPVSKLSIGFVSGGVDYTGKNPDKKNIFTTVAMRMLLVGDVVNLIEKSPELISKLKDAFGSKKDK